MKETYLTPKLREGQEVDLSKYNPRQRTNIRLYGLDAMNWTPQNVYEYKMKWLPDATRVRIHDFRVAQKWCKENLFLQDWHINKYHYPDDTHDMLFKNPQEAMLFKLSVDTCY